MVQGDPRLSLMSLPVAGPIGIRRDHSLEACHVQEPFGEGMADVCGVMTAIVDARTT